MMDPTPHDGVPAQDDDDEDLISAETLDAIERRLSVVERGALTPQTMMVLLDDIADIWNDARQMITAQQQAQSEMQKITTAIYNIERDLRQQRALLEQRIPRRLRRERPMRATVEGEPLVELDAEAPRQRSSEGGIGTGQSGEIYPSGSEGAMP